MTSNDFMVGVPPHPRPWPEGEQYDPELLEHGDRRNVADQYRYWTIEAIRRDLGIHHHKLQIAVENWQNDFNIGTIVRSANAFNVAAVHIIGKRHWNRRGAMVTDRYLDIRHHPTIEAFLSAVQGYSIVAVDNVEGATILSDVSLPHNAVLVFGGEGPGISEEMLAVSEQIVAIEQFGSTRSVNVGVAAGIVMYSWLQQHAL